MSVDLSKLNPQELEQLIAEAAKLKTQKLKENMAEVRSKIREAAKAEGYTIEELFGLGGSRKKAASAPKYANPADPSQTWTGRGKRPGWFKDALAKGSRPEALEI